MAFWKKHEVCKAQEKSQKCETSRKKKENLKKWVQKITFIWGVLSPTRATGGQYQELAPMVKAVKRVLLVVIDVVPSLLLAITKGWNMFLIKIAALHCNNRHNCIYFLFSTIMLFSCLPWIFFSGILCLVKFISDIFYVMHNTPIGH